MLKIMFSLILLAAVIVQFFKQTQQKMIIFIFINYRLRGSVKHLIITIFICVCQMFFMTKIYLTIRSSNETWGFNIWRLSMECMHVQKSVHKASTCYLKFNRCATVFNYLIGSIKMSWLNKSISFITVKRWKLNIFYEKNLSNN